MSVGEPTDGHIWVIFNLLQGALSATGMSLNLVEMCILVILSTSAAVGAYRLTMAVLPENEMIFARRMAASSAAIVWVANPFALSFAWFHQLATEVTLAAVPWLALLMIGAIRNTKSIWSYAPLTVLVAVLGSIGLQLFYLPAIFLTLGLFATALVLSSPRKVESLRGAAIFLGVLIASLLWWVIPSIYVANAVYLGANLGPSSLDQFLYASRSSSVANVVSLTAVPELYSGVGSDPYISWAPFVTSGPGHILRFVLPATAALGLITGLKFQRFRPLALASAVCIVIAIAMSKGLNPPFPNVNRALLNLPFGNVFRHSVDKFAVMLALPFSILSGVALLTLWRDRWSSVSGAAVTFVICFLMALPWWSGTVIPGGGGQLPSARVAVPPSYEIVGRDLAQASPGGKTMVLPYSELQASAFVWRSGIQPNSDCLFEDWAPNRTLVCRPNGSELSDRVGEVVVQAVINRDPRVFDLARLWGIDRWLVHEDWATAYMPTQTPPKIADAFLQSTGGQSLALVDSSPELRLWAQPALPVVYAARSLHVDHAQFSGEEILSAANSVAKLSAPVILDSISPDWNIDPTATTTFDMSNPTDIRGVLNVSGKTVLVLSQSFDDGWRLVVNGQVEPASRHVLANGFANGWLIDHAINANWELQYVPEERATVGYGVATVLLVGSAGTLLYRGTLGIRTRRRKLPSTKQKTATH
jgi:hypothetical protein